MSRMAALGSFLKSAFAPQGATRGGKIADLAMSYAPDLAFAGLTAATAPGGFNAAVGAEDLALSLLGSSLGRIGGRYAGQKLFPDNPEAIGRVQQVADLVGSVPLQMLAPRPMLNAAIEKEYAGQARKQEQAQAEARQGETYEQLANALITAGGLVRPGALGLEYQVV